MNWWSILEGAVSAFLAIMIFVGMLTVVEMFRLLREGTKR